MIDVAAAEQCCEALIGYLRYLGVLQGKTQPQEVTLYGKIVTIAAPHPGLFLPEATPGMRCKAGECLGSFEGTPVTAPFDGVISTISKARYCFAGERMAAVAPHKTE